ncbi:MAG: histidinol phosphate phosphatase [Dehalococcoidia bacterium]|nr:histidinol phosphate phosphatase [Dehalococcoidia bacterium]
MASDLAALLTIARQAAALAGDVVMPLYQANLTVELKADRTPVTIADRKAEEAMRSFFARETPDFGVLGEEFGATAGTSARRWVLDPIDGTKSFIHHVPLFGTLVALEEDGEPVIGVIACHAVGETAWAAHGCGAFLNGVPARVSATTDLSRATLLLTSVAAQEGLPPERLARLSAEVSLLRTWGDCYGYLAVAAGRADAMIDPVMSRWDAAALYPVIREAGGKITTWHGSPLVGASVAASNGAIHERLLSLLAT